MGVIYKIINVATDDFYVGSAVKPKRRKWEHWTALKNGAHHCVRLQAAWNEFGEDAFEFDVIEEVDDQNLLQVEDIYLSANAGQPHCYNTALSTQIPSSTQPEVRSKISESLKRNFAERPDLHPRLGKKHTAETKQLIREKKLANPTKAWLGERRDEETRKKIGDAQRGVKKAPRTFTPAGLERARENMKRNAKEQVPKAFADVLAKFPQEVRDKYDFSNAVYTGALVRIEGCICPIHGTFSQYAAQFRKGRGCPQCGADQRAESKRNQMKEYWGTAEGREQILASRRKTY